MIDAGDLARTDDDSSNSAPRPPRLTAAERVERDRQERAMRRDLDTLATEIEDMARRVGAELEQRAERLEQLLRDADQRIARLEAAAPPTHETPGASHNGASSSNPPTGGAPAASATVPSPSAAIDHRPASHDLVEDPLTRRVHELADRGQSAADIANALHEHVGKIELILALRSASGE